MKRMRTVVMAVTIPVIAIGVVLFLRDPGPVMRQTQYRLTGAIDVDQGFSVFLRPSDTLITPMMIQYGTWEPSETKFIRDRLKPGDTLIDIGAYIGYYSILGARKVGQTGKVFAFEPEPTNASLLRRNIARNKLTNITAEEKAVSNENGKVTLYVATDGNNGDNSIFERSGEHKKSVDVPAIRLDDYLKDHPGRVDLIKIDTQGAEGFIVEGMANTLDANPGIAMVLEFWPQGLSEAHYDPGHLLDLLTGHGFALQELDDESGKITPVTREQMLKEYTPENKTFTNLILMRPSAAPPTP